MFKGSNFFSTQHEHTISGTNVKSNALWSIFKTRIAPHVPCSAAVFQPSTLPLVLRCPTILREDPALLIKLKNYV